MKSTQLTQYRRALCLPVLVFVCTTVSAQNLVQNPSFEEHDDCPSSGGQLPYALQWSAPPNNDAEYFNGCSTHPDYSVPSQGGLNFQEAHSGNAYAGCFMYNGTGNNYREYIQSQLLTTLLPNRAYYVEFWVNRGNGYVGGKYAVNNISLSFQTSITDTTSSSGQVLNYPSNIIKFTNPVIDDTLNWVKINGVYLANGTENFIVIGNQSNDELTDTLDMQDETYSGSYYFIDDVLVEEIPSPIWDYRDTTIYYGESVLIGPSITGLDIDWFTANMEFLSNAPGIVVSPATSRNYIAKETFNGTETTNIVHVTVIGGAGVEENELEQMVVYPNPAKNEFFISGIINHEPMEIVLRDIDGKIVSEWKKDLTNGLNAFTLNVDNGIYFVNVINPVTNESSVKKLVIQ